MDYQVHTQYLHTQYLQISKQYLHTFTMFTGSSVCLVTLKIFIFIENTSFIWIFVRSTYVTTLGRLIGVVGLKELEGP